MIELISDRALWNWWSPVWLVAVSVAIVYGRYSDWANPAKTSWLIAGLSVLVFAFVSPLGVLADGFLFSAHMIQHLLLLLVVPLCLVLSLPRSVAGSVWAGRCWGGPRRCLSQGHATSRCQSDCRLAVGVGRNVVLARSSFLQRSDRALCPWCCADNDLSCLGAVVLVADLFSKQAGSFAG